MTIHSRLFCTFLLLSLVLVTGCAKSTTPVVSTPSADAVESTASAEQQVLAEQQAAAPIEEGSSVDGALGDAKLGQLRVRFEFGGEAVEPEKTNVTKDKAFCGKTDLRDERLLVNAKNKGIRNVLVYVYTGRGGSELAETPSDKKVVILANEKCRFVPRIVLARPGDTLKVTNPDDVGHNVNISFFANKGVNLMIPPKEFEEVEIIESEPAPIPTECNIHPWMRCYLVVTDHPFVGVSDESGNLTIDGLPVGEKLVFRAYHEACAIKAVTINGQEQAWNRSRFEVEIQPGLNDLGTVVIPADAFNAK